MENCVKISILLFLFSGCVLENRESSLNEVTQNERHLAFYKEAIYNGLDISDFYEENLLYIDSNFSILNQQNKGVKINSLFTSTHTVLFRFNEISSCMSCVDNEYIELKKLEETGLIKLIIVLDSTSLQQMRIVSSRFRTDVYSLVKNNDILTLGHKVIHPHVIVFSNYKAEKFYILGPKTRVYSGVFREAIKQYVTSK